MSRTESEIDARPFADRPEQYAEVTEAGDVRVYVPVAPPPAEHTCSTCPFYFRFAAHGRDGHCRRGPRFEQRKLGDWCGEHPGVRAGVEDGTWPGQHEATEREELTSGRADETSDRGGLPAAGGPEKDVGGIPWPAAESAPGDPEGDGAEDPGGDRPPA